MKKNAIIKVLLCAAILLAGAVSPVVTKAGDAVVTGEMTSTEKFVAAKYDVANYRSAKPYTYPKKAGYVFAGWYTDAACAEETALASDVTTGKAYAKFVDEAILGVKCQITRETKSEDPETNLRIVTSVGSGMYDKVGFKIQFEGQDPFYTSIDTAYKKMEGWANGSNKLHKPSELFSENSEYLAGCTVTGFTNDYFDDTLTITARWKTLDGTTVEGSVKRFSVDDIVQLFDYDNANVDERVGKVAKVGDTYYETFAAALDAANTSTEDVTLQLLADVDIANNGITINNVNGKNITIDGCGHTLSANATSVESMKMYQSSGAVTIKNLDINHSGTWPIMRMGDNNWTNSTTDVTVNFENVDMVSTTNYQYFLIGTQDPGTFNINMTDVTVDWNTGEKTNRAFVRCGADDTNKEQTVNLNMNGCALDLSGTKAQAMNITNGASGTIDLAKTEITTLGVEAFANAGGATINVASDCILNKNGNAQVQIGDVTYNTFAAALTAANASTEDVTLQLLADVDIANNGITINNVNGNDITIDGCGHTLSANATSVESMKMYQSSGTVTIKNLDINHSGTWPIMRMGDNNWTNSTTDVTVNFENVDMVSTTNYQYFLIGTQDPGTFNINMTDVTVDWNTGEKTNRAFIRCGADDTNKEQTVNLNMTGCALDFSGTKAQAVNMTKGASGTINLENTRIITLGVETFANAGGATIEVAPDCVLSKDGDAQAKIGDVTYETFAAALDAANASEEDVTIQLLGDMNIEKSAVTINNVNGKNITIDGCGHTLNANATTVESLKMNQSSGTVTIKNLDINHSGTWPLMRMGDNVWDDGITYGVTVNLENVDIASTTTYQYFLIGTQDPGTFNINMTDVIVEWNDTANTQAQRAFIRYGGGSASKVQTVNVDMTRCAIDVSGAALTQGGYITLGATVNITSDNSTTITTAGGVNGYTKEANSQNAFLEALTFANASKEDVTIKLSGDMSITSANVTIDNVNGKNITIDGNGKKLNVTSNYGHSIVIHQSSGVVTIKNLTINHTGKYMLMRLGEGSWTDAYDVTVNFENVGITSTGTYQYCLIGTQDKGTFNINMKDVTVNWNETANTQAQRAFIRYGGGSASKVQTVNVDMIGCTIDVSGAALTHGWYITAGATVNITSDDNTTISTADDVTEYTNVGKLTINGESK